MAEETPLIRQYRQIKEKRPDMVLFFRLGDFYEMFDSDAIEVSRLLNLALTQRAGVPMCGIPYHAAKTYIKRLLDCSRKIAICEQIELMDKGLAKREVVRVITPATVLDEDFLDGGSNNYLLSIKAGQSAFCDLSTGDFFLKSLDSRLSIGSLLEEVRPSEILVDADEYYTDKAFSSALDDNGAMVTKLPGFHFSLAGGYKLLCRHAGTVDLDAFGIDAKNKCLGAAGALMRYLEETRCSSDLREFSYKVLEESQYLGLDENARRNLELFYSLSDHTAQYSLFSTIRRTVTSGGQRMLSSWLSMPLGRVDAINERQDKVAWLVQRPEELARLRSLLEGSLDVMRISSRIGMLNSLPRDLVGLKQSIACFFSIIAESEDFYRTIGPGLFTQRSFEALSSLMSVIDRAISPDVAGPYESSKVILDGYDADLDSKRAIGRDSSSVFDAYLESVKSETGITIMKLGYNKIIGYFLEVPKTQVPRIPASFLRKQTLVSAERYTTERLIEFERQSLSADAQANARERELYDEIVQQARQACDILDELGLFFANSDSLASLAYIALEKSWCRPELIQEGPLVAKAVRHPVVESQCEQGVYVANDVDMSVPFTLMTGPNMAGKSTYLRMTAILVILAHMGSYVPAQSAKVPLTDRVFCRVGSADNLARGQSTFMVEMKEASYIVRTCTTKSLVIMDEIGRGTSTQEGMSLAYAIMDFLVAKKVKTLFATHYHELTGLDTSSLRLLTLEVAQVGNDVLFLRKIKEGVSDSSYALHVARLAGLPASILRKAAVFQKKHFSDYALGQGDLFTSSLIEEKDIDPVKVTEELAIQELRNIDADSLSPLDALLRITELKKLLDKD
ncbi:MAG: DNA mismatch repair protein MutS [Sphaerochaetaceae bacterium]|nr:DNA mismatch repair protein MutS [Sphaerochaetaceae bacterium]